MDSDDIGMGSTNRQACASCKHQRKKCSQQCLLSPFFPAEKNQQFQAVHKLFGVSNVTKLLKSLQFDERKQAIDSLIWEAQCREFDPVLGCYGEYSRVVNELQLLKNQQHQQQQQQQEVIVVAATQTDHLHPENTMNKPLMIDYPYHGNNNGIIGGGVGDGVDTTVVNYNNQHMEQNQQQHQHGYGYGYGYGPGVPGPAGSMNMNVQGQEKRFETRDSSTTNGHVICLPTSFNQSHHTFNQNQSYYYDPRKL